MSVRSPSYGAEGPGPAARAGDPSCDAELARLAKALGHRSRVRIVRCLAAGRCRSCGELVTQVAQAQSTVSQHVKKLKDAGLIRAEPDPPHACRCSVNEAVLRRFKELVAAI